MREPFILDSRSFHARGLLTIVFSFFSFMIPESRMSILVPIFGGPSSVAVLVL